MESYYDYGYDYGNFGGLFGSSDFMAVFGMVLGLMAVFVLIAWATNLAWYIFRSIGLYKLSENRGMSGSALAWIPFIGFYRIGSIADDIVARNGGRSYYRLVLLIGGIVNIVGGIVSWAIAMFGHSQFLGKYYFSPYGYNRQYSESEYFDAFITYWGTSLLFSVISLALFVLTIIALNKIYKCYRPMSSTSWTVLSVIFPFMQSIFLFIIRNAAPVPEWSAQGYYPMQNATPNQNWQAPPPQYPPYGGQPPANGGYPPQNQGWQQPAQPVDSYQPPMAPNPPEPWEIEDPASQPPPRAPWEENGDGEN